MDVIRFDRLTDFPALPGWSRIAAAAGFDGAVLGLWIEEAGRASVTARIARGIGIFPSPRMQQTRRFRLSVWRAGRDTSWIDLPALDLTFPIADLFPDGRVLLVAPRCSWRGPGDYDLNGVVFDPATGGMTRFLLGDGINDAQVDSLGRVWVSYMDEGVFGNFGWGDPGPEPVGARGLVCFSDRGEKLWEYPGDSAIADCYGLNVWGDEVAICYYTDFPLGRISPDFAVREWATGLQGSHHLAVSADRVLFTHGYDDPPDTAYLGRIGETAVEGLQPVRLEMPDGSPIPVAPMAGRGDGLYLFGEDAVYRARLG